jgi:hypothetical protein
MALKYNPNEFANSNTAIERTPSSYITGWRASTINANVPEPLFQTLERHGETVVERVAAFVTTLMHRARRPVVCTVCLSCGRRFLRIRVPSSAPWRDGHRRSSTAGYPGTSR